MTPCSSVNRYTDVSPGKREKVQVESVCPGAKPLSCSWPESGHLLTQPQPSWIALSDERMGESFVNVLVLVLHTIFSYKTIYKLNKVYNLNMYNLHLHDYRAKF